MMKRSRRNHSAAFKAKVALAAVKGREKQWDAEITEQVPDDRISWKSLSNDAPNAGTVRFEAIDANRTRVRLVMAYEPKGAVETIGDALGILSASVQRSIANFKKYIESKRVADGAWRGTVHDSVADPNDMPR
jgi:uncharacterized membrane protein